MSFRVHALLAAAVGGLPALALGQAVSPAVFVANGSNDSVSSFTVGPDGSLTLVSTLSTPFDPDNVRLSPNGRYLAAPQASQNSTEVLTIFEVGADASLTQVGVFGIPDAPLDSLWINDSTLAVVSTNFSNSAINTYSFNPAGPSLTPIDNVTTGAFTTTLAYRDGVLLSNASLGAGSVSSWAVNNGELSLIETQGVVEGQPLTLALTPEGNYVYSGVGATGVTDREILALSVASDGSLTQITPSTQSPFATPNELAVSADGNVLVVGHSEGTMATFLIDSSTGGLTYSGFSTDFGLGIDLADLATLNNLIFVADDDEDLIKAFELSSDGSFDLVGSAASGGTGYRSLTTWVGIPEPTSLAGLGLAAGGLLRRKR